MRSIVEMQAHFEYLNKIHDKIELTGQSQKIVAAPALEGPTTEEARKSVAAQSYLVSDLIMEQVAESERDAFILLAHLVQKLDWIASGNSSPDIERALKAGQALLFWLEQNAKDRAEVNGWIADTVADSRSKVAARIVVHEFG